MSTEEYKETMREAREIMGESLPRIVLDLSAAVLIWLFGRLIYLPIAEGIEFAGYPLTEILNFVILAALIIIVVKVIVDVRKFIDGLSSYAAAVVGTDYDVSDEEVGHYETALTGLFDVVVISLAYILLVDYFSGIHPALAGITLLALVIWAIFKLWGVVDAISDEIERYTAKWSQKALEE